MSSEINTDPIVLVSNICKQYRLFKKPADRIIESLSSGRIVRHTKVSAVNEMSFDIVPGESLGIIGGNGSGKSTLLQIIAGLIPPSSGQIKVRGRIAAILDLGAGFNPEFTGIENAKLSASMYGLTRSEIVDKLDTILDFSELGHFLDHPVKTYSSGMFLRLAFSVACHASADILLIDEVLAVGDVFFQQKCISKIRELREQGVSIVLVSHDLYQVQRMCNQCIVLNSGDIIYQGDPKTAVDIYYKQQYRNLQPSTVHERFSGTASEQAGEKTESNKTTVWLERFERSPSAPNIRYENQVSNDGVEILKVAVFNDQGFPCYSFRVGESVVVMVRLRALNGLVDYEAGAGIRDRTGFLIGGYHTLHAGDQTKPLGCSEVGVFRFRFTLSVAPGTYTLIVGFARHAGDIVWNDLAVLFSACQLDVVGRANFWGVSQLQSEAVSMSIDQI